MKKVRVWKMPKELEKYRKFIVNTGGNSIEDLMNDTETTAQTNVILAALIISVDSQISLLQHLYKEGLLK